MEISRGQLARAYLRRPDGVNEFDATGMWWKERDETPASRHRKKRRVTLKPSRAEVKRRSALAKARAKVKAKAAAAKARRAEAIREAKLRKDDLSC